MKPAKCRKTYRVGNTITCTCGLQWEAGEIDPHTMHNADHVAEKVAETAPTVEQAGKALENLTNLAASKNFNHWRKILGKKEK